MRRALVDDGSTCVFLGGIMSDVDFEHKPLGDAAGIADFHPAGRNQLHLHLGFSRRRPGIGAVIFAPFISVVQANFQSKRDAIHREHTAAATTSLIHFAHEIRGTRLLETKRALAFPEASVDVLYFAKRSRRTLRRY